MMEANRYYPYSNKADMLFLDTYPQEVGSQGFYDTIAHELQHLINFSINSNSGQDVWIDEGLATAAEYLYHGEHTERVDMFNKDYEDRIKYGDNFFVWDNYLADYATAYMFFQWLRIHADNGTDIYKEIVSSSYKDYRAIVEIANAHIARLDDASLWDWEVLLRTWMLANARNDASGLYGYKEELTAKFWCFDSTNITHSFAPGEGIFSQMSGTSSTPGNSGTNIKYVGFGNDTLDTSGAVYDGQYLLTFNANTAKSGFPETGYLANGAIGAAGDRSMSLVQDGDALNSDTPDAARPAKPYGIGVQFKPDGTILRRE
jgi:hypothetical protein